MNLTTKEIRRMIIQEMNSIISGIDPMLIMAEEMLKVMHTVNYDKIMAMAEKHSEAYFHARTAAGKNPESYRNQILKSAGNALYAYQKSRNPQDLEELIFHLEDMKQEFSSYDLRKPDNDPENEPDF